MTNHLVGLRPEDLTAEERETLAELLVDPQHAAEQAFADDLAQLSHTIPPSTSAASILQQARRPPPSRRSWATFGGVAAIAATTLAVALLAQPASRPRGSTASAPVRLHAVVDGTHRALGPRAAIGPKEQVVFQVHTPGPGRVEIREDATTLVHSWTTRGGSELLGGDRPLAWRPESPAPAQRVYVVRWCPDGGGVCSSDELSLQWR